MVIIFSSDCSSKIKIERSKIRGVIPPFKGLLTNNEQKAFDIIKNNLVNGYGYVSISQLTENNNISRPVFKNVLQKMKDSKVAEVTNKGVKGTYIEVIDSSIL